MKVKRLRNFVLEIFKTFKTIYHLKPKYMKEIFTKLQILPIGGLK